VSLSIRTGIPPSVLEQEEEAVIATMIDLLVHKQHPDADEEE
jgi:hypothetical protein